MLPDEALNAVLFAPLALPAFATAFGLNVLLLRLQVPPLAGVILILSVYALPYTTYTMPVAYGAHDRRFEDEARILGASRWQVLTRVHLPLLAPALARSAFLAFLGGWSDYLITLLVGGGAFITVQSLAGLRCFRTPEHASRWSCSNASDHHAEQHHDGRLDRDKRSKPVDGQLNCESGQLC